MPRMRHPERHVGHRTGWLRAAVLGANDGIVSTAAIIVGVAAADSGRAAIMTAGVAGLVAGAASMAAGEYVSVSSQVDAERADLDIERAELRADPAGERQELARIYRERGLSEGLAEAVADELSARDDLLQVHARDELGMTELSHAAAAAGGGHVCGGVHGWSRAAAGGGRLRAVRRTDPDHDGRDDGRARRHRLGGRASRRRSARVAARSASSCGGSRRCC